MIWENGSSTNPRISREATALTATCNWTRLLSGFWLFLLKTIREINQKKQKKMIVVIIRKMYQNSLAFIMEQTS